MELKNTIRRLIKKAMNVELGDKGLTKSFQKEFPSNTRCVHCGDKARIAFVAHEMDNVFNKDTYLSDLHKNIPENAYWVHDACSVAVYFCEKCLEPTALMNQA